MKDSEKHNVSVFDVAAYILENYQDISGETDPCPRMKLHNLLYYSQAWALVLHKTDEPFFPEKILAWGTCGACIQEILDFQQEDATHMHKGDPEKIPEHHQRTLDMVLEQYGTIDPTMLTIMVKSEDPWLKARKRAKVSLAAQEQGNEEISLQDMKRYYRNL